MQAVFTMYLATSELIISDNFERGDQLPVVFGVVAAFFGLAALINSRLVEKYGIDTMVDFATRIELVLGPILVIIAITGGGRPNFWIFMPVLTVMLSLFMLLLPNLNTAALVPVGHIAGSASAVTSGLRIGIGSLIASGLNGFIKDSVTPFALTVCVMCFAMATAIWFTRRGLDDRLA